MCIIINCLFFKGYVGLVNQAMTCYLNSLLQALYMTPEFRNALYNWEYVEGSEKDEANSIPYQLQKLFLNLQVLILSTDIHKINKCMVVAKYLINMHVYRHQRNQQWKLQH